MIAPNNHLPFKRIGFLDTSNVCRQIMKTELNDTNGKDEEEDRENRNKANNSKDE